MRSPIDTESPGRVPIGPFRQWLAARRNDAELISDDPSAHLARILDIDPDLLGRWLWSTQQHVGLDRVDRCFCRWGEPGLLRQLYPELYDFPEQEAAERMAYLSHLRFERKLKWEAVIIQFRARYGVELSVWNARHLATCDPAKINRPSLRRLGVAA